MVKHVFAVCMIVIELFLESNCSTNVISSFVHIKWYWKTAWRFNVVSANILILHPNPKCELDGGRWCASFFNWKLEPEPGKTFNSQLSTTIRWHFDIPSRVLVQKHARIALKLRKTIVIIINHFYIIPIQSNVTWLEAWVHPRTIAIPITIGVVAIIITIIIIATIIIIVITTIIHFEEVKVILMIPVTVLVRMRTLRLWIQPRIPLRY